VETKLLIEIGLGGLAKPKRATSEGKKKRRHENWVGGAKK